MKLPESVQVTVLKLKNHEHALLRGALVLVFVWIGAMKFTSYEANGIAPLIKHSPLMSWLHALLGIEGASYAIGVAELVTAIALVAGSYSATLDVVGASMSVGTFLTTLTFLISTPGVAESSAGGFPAISAMPGQFVLKDVVLLAASLVLLMNALQNVSGSAPTARSGPTR